jgi:hypothetical protein
MHSRGPDKMSRGVSFGRGSVSPRFCQQHFWQERTSAGRVCRGYRVFRSLYVASGVEISKRLRESMGHVCIEFTEKTSTFVS